VYGEVEVKVADPVTVFRETVGETSSRLCRATSPNAKNVLSFVAEPLEKGLAGAIEKEEIRLDMPKKTMQSFFQERFGYDMLAARSVWASGPEERGYTHNGFSLECKISICSGEGALRVAYLGLEEDRTEVVLLGQAMHQVTNAADAIRIGATIVSPQALSSARNHVHVDDDSTLAHGFRPVLYSDIITEKAPAEYLRLPCWYSMDGNVHINENHASRITAFIPRAGRSSSASQESLQIMEPAIVFVSISPASEDTENADVRLEDAQQAVLVFMRCLHERGSTRQV